MEALGAFFEEGTGRFRALWRLVFQYWIYRVAVPLFANLLVIGWLLLRSGAEGPPASLDASVLAGSPCCP
jgi:hypothetical protein